MKDWKEGSEEMDPVGVPLSEWDGNGRHSLFDLSRGRVEIRCSHV